MSQQEPPVKDSLDLFRDQEGYMKCPHCGCDTFHLNARWFWGELVMPIICSKCEKAVDQVIPDYISDEAQREAYEAQTEASN